MEPPARPQRGRRTVGVLVKCARCASLGVASMPSRTSRPRSSPSAGAACVSARSARSASLRSLAKRLGGSLNLTVTAEKTEVGVPAPAGTDRYVDCMQLCPYDANGTDDRNARVRLAAQGLERIGRREVGLLPVQPNSIGERPTLCLGTNMPSDGNSRACTPLFLHTAVNRRRSTRRAKFDLSAEGGVWSTRVRFGADSCFLVRAYGSRRRVYITCTSSTDAY